MTLAASWEMAPADGARRSESMDVVVAADVDALLLRLGTPPADDAYLDDRRFADRDASPVVKLAVRGEWAYLRWLDDDFDGVPVGDTGSPAAHGGYEPDYPAGSGIPVPLASAALKQWLATGARPTAVDWVDMDDIGPM